MARIFFLFALLALASVGAYNKYEGGQNEKLFLSKKNPKTRWQNTRSGNRSMEEPFKSGQFLFTALNFCSLRSIDNGGVNPFVYHFKIATRDRMWDILVILAAV